MMYLDAVGLRIIKLIELAAMSFSAIKQGNRRGLMSQCSARCLLCVVKNG